MRTKIPKPKSGSIIYDDKKVYACLASRPMTKGHVFVIWKKRVKDIHFLSDRDYGHLMDIVDDVRDAMLKTLKVKKVYLIYMDETKHVHWHLIPRYNEQGYDVFAHKPKILKDVSLAQKIKKNLKLK